MAHASPVVNIISFLGDLPPEQRSRLFDSPWTCQAVFRSLKPLAKNYVLRLLLVTVPVPQEVVDAWPSDPTRHATAHQAALSSLLDLDLYRQGQQAGRPTFQLHPTFQAQLQWALSTGGHMLGEVPRSVLAAAPGREALDAFAHNQWEALQMYLLDPGSPGPCLPPGVALDPLDVHRVLLNARLLSGPRSSRSITDAGFQFLLRDSHRQLWAFLTQYINDAAMAAASANQGGDLASLMSFLMQLGFMRVGVPYALHGLGPLERVVAGHMMQLGLLLPFTHQRQSYFCPTRLATSLCGGGGGSGDAHNTDIAGGHIIVESNFKVNAWTTSRVQRSLLGLFCRCEASLPNFWVGALTHDSINSALASGIAAEEIVAYLQSHAHPQVAKRKPVVPENVCDQVRLWEAETMRMRADPAVFYDNFENPDLFEHALAFTRHLGSLLWSAPTSRAFAAREADHDRIKDYIKSVKAAQAVGAPLPSPTPPLSSL
ncbi:Tfb2-domain-containing protein [Haematococcus lacustris]